MIFTLAEYCYQHQLWHPYSRVLRYITVRGGLAIFTALFLSFLLGPLVLRILRRYKIGQNIRQEHVKDLYALHKTKQGTPTMGGILILAVLMLTTLLWADLSHLNIKIMLLTTIGLGAIGFYDDYLKLVKKNNKGLKPRYKLMGQVGIGLVVGCMIYFGGLTGAKLWGAGIPRTLDSVLPFLSQDYTTVLTVPFIKDLLLPLGVCYLFFAILMVVASSNAVNLTDGLDGLAIGQITLCALVYTIFAYAVGNWRIAHYLNILYISGSGELTVFCAALLGAGLGFLWFNCNPAEMFMGDTGSLSLGGILGVVALLIKMELVLVIAGGVFVLETLSVILQVWSYRLRGGKRIFRMAPFHHHLELGGLKETKVVIRLWITAIVCSILALSSLKLR